MGKVGLVFDRPQNNVADYAFAAPEFEERVGPVVAAPDHDYGLELVLVVLDDRDGVDADQVKSDFHEGHPGAFE